MANIKVSDQELKAILSELESELQSALGTSLAKSEDGDEKSKSAPPKKDGEGSSSEGGDKAPPSGGEGGEGAPPPPEGSEGGDVPPPPGADAPPAPGADAAPAPAAPPAPATPAAQGAPVADPAAVAPAAPADPAALQAEYAQMAPDQLKVHYLAAKAALFAATQAAAPAPAAPPAPPAPPAGPMGAPPAPPMAGPAGAPPVLKGEKGPGGFSTTLEGKDDVNPGGKIPDVARDTTLEGQNGVKKGEKMPSEQNGKLPNTPTTPDIAKSEKNELAELKLQLEVMTKALSKIAGVPMQKAVTDLTYVAKSEGEVKNTELNAEQIKAKLNEVARNPLTKSEDRQLMNKYVCGSVSVDAIKHLLK